MEIEIQDGILIRKHETTIANGDIWFIHAFAESGLCYKEVFNSVLTASYNIYVPDLPGFGVSPFNPKYKSIKDYSFLLYNIITRSQPKNECTIIVAHSVSGLIGTWTCEMLNSKRIIYINVEGNLTEADNYFTGKTLLYDDGTEFFAAFSNEIYLLSLKDERFRRYYSSLQFADPRALIMMGRSALDFSQGDKCGHQFKNLTCQKVYVYGDKDTPHASIEFIRQNHISSKFFSGIGHWHMIENDQIFYNYVKGFIENGLH